MSTYSSTYKHQSPCYKIIFKLLQVLLQVVLVCTTVHTSQVFRRQDKMYTVLQNAVRAKCSQLSVVCSAYDVNSYQLHGPSQQ